MFEKLVRSMRMYRQRPSALGLAIGMSLAIHVCNALAFYFISLGLPVPSGVERPSLVAHATAALLALATGALPVGALEVVFNIIFRGVSGPEMPQQQGFLIVLTYRLLQMCIALIGLYYYLAGRREVDEILHEAEEASHPHGASIPAG
jgi:predicted lysophospholipase L1 biosynthesis ABC-type transport system permease subunit